MSDNARAHLIHSFRKILRPLVRILIRAGVRFDEFVEVIKGIYVESAIRDGVGRDAPVTRSRVTLATGLARRDVDRYVDNEALLAPPAPTYATTLTEVLHHWHTDPKYLGPYGVPLEIDFDSTTGRCFSDLVYRTDPEADPSVVLEDLKRSGVVVQSGEKFLRVTSRTYVMQEAMSAVTLEHLGRMLGNLADTMVFNMGDATSPKRLERSVFADNGLSPEQLPEFEAYARARVQQLIEEVDDWLAKYASDLPRQETRLATGISIFHYVETQPPKQRLRDLVSQ